MTGVKVEGFGRSFFVGKRFGTKAPFYVRQWMLCGRIVVLIYSA